MMRTMRVLLSICACALLVMAGCKKESAAEAGAAPAADGAAASSVLDLDDTTFAAATAQGVVLVDFWAPWCPPCRAQGPIIDDVAKQLGDTAKVAKVNVDKAKTTAQAFGVRSIPTLVVLKDGKTVKSFTGLTQADALVAAVKEAL